jgi:hypothetical protein
MRFWRWQWPQSEKKKKGKLRQWHFPEADYLATLAALLRVKGREPEATLLPFPAPYDISNYTFNREFTDEIRQSMRLILDQRDFALAHQRVSRLRRSRRNCIATCLSASRNR